MQWQPFKLPRFPLYLCQTVQIIYPLSVLPFLENFDKIYLWMDEDEAGKSNIPKMVEKLGKNRTVIIKK